ncbi:MAG: radical SAM/Cys-rich domain protein [FCB group bacterium]|nr:radical SAM/Cys-rich domain protein [FCB group bacterium]
MKQNGTAFSQLLKKHGVDFSRRRVSTLQVNLGKLCNQACLHCHVNAGPGRKEIMDKGTIDRLLDLIDASTTLCTVDLTGGAPELNPYFRYFVHELTRLKVKIIDRCNLTVLLEPGQEDTAEFLRDHGVEIYSSMPCYLRENVDAQRGGGVYDKSIKALQQLNDLGFGQPGMGLILNLVYNPGGISLPPDQSKLQKDYKERLYRDWGIEFNELFTITNMPIKRFKKYLEREGLYDKYMGLLEENFNPVAALNVMCREMISVDWRGHIYDCDFNQMLELPVGNQTTTVWEIDGLETLDGYPITCGRHCFGCTAGAGSSCGGEVVLKGEKNESLLRNIIQF